MPVGKGSLLRASKLQENEVKEEPEKVAKKSKTPATEKKVSAKKPVVTASVITASDSIHEKKFEAISKITCELPTYLL